MMYKFAKTKVYLLFGVMALFGVACGSPATITPTPTVEEFEYKIVSAEAAPRPVSNFFIIFPSRSSLLRPYAATERPAEVRLRCEEN